MDASMMPRSGPALRARPPKRKKEPGTLGGAPGLIEDQDKRMLPQHAPPVKCADRRARVFGKVVRR